jgi:hypothetical protein
LIRSPPWLMFWTAMVSSTVLFLAFVGSGG